MTKCLMDLSSRTDMVASPTLIWRASGGADAGVEIPAAPSVLKGGSGGIVLKRPPAAPPPTSVPRPPLPALPDWPLREEGACRSLPEDCLGDIAGLYPSRMA